MWSEFLVADGMSNPNKLPLLNSTSIQRDYLFSNLVKNFGEKI